MTKHCIETGFAMAGSCQKPKSLYESGRKIWLLVLLLI